jgi:hypothetical protein
MALTRASIVDALTAERAISMQGAPFEVLDADWEENLIVLSVKPGKSRHKLPLDEGLEGARIRWGQVLDEGGLIKMVDPDKERIVLQLIEGRMPEAGKTVWVFQNDFLGPLIDMWNGPMASLAAKRLRQSKDDLDPLQPVKPLPDDYRDLRERQVEAVQSAAYRCSIVIGPPGTGKSYTIGALTSYLLRRFPKGRVLVVGPTNVAVDTAILAIDDWLQRLGRHDLAMQVKRIGAHFDPKKYAERPHLLAEGIAERVNDYLLLEATEPPKAKIAEYVKWKDQMATARASLGADIEETAAGARVVGVTVATAIRWHEYLRAPAFPFVLCDEASQVLGPAAMMITTLGQQTIFAGDPNQLSPIARTENKSIRGQLTRTAFDTFSHVKTTRLNEQSRMTQAICTAIGTTFYDGDLRVCRKAARDAEWKRERSAFYVDGREVPRICFDEVGEPATYSPKYGGFIRYDSAQLVLNACDKLAGSYVDPSDIVVLTPFRAQVALIRQFLRRNHPQISVSTIHRAQGSEKTLVIVDPVDASSPFFSGAEGRRLINVAISRAKAHVVIPIHGGDLANPSLKKIHTQSTKFWNRAGNFAQPFTFR